METAVAAAADVIVTVLVKNSIPLGARLVAPTNAVPTVMSLTGLVRPSPSNRKEEFEGIPFSPYASLP
jgi:hypothetical protein